MYGKAKGMVGIAQYSSMVNASVVSQLPSIKTASALPLQLKLKNLETLEKFSPGI